MPSLSNITRTSAVQWLTTRELPLLMSKLHGILQGPFNISNQKSFQNTHLGSIRNLWPKIVPNHPSGVYSKLPRKTPSEALRSHSFTFPRNIPSKYPRHSNFRKPYQRNPLPQTQSTTHTLHQPSLLPLAPPLLHLTHGIYQTKLVATPVTLY